jgi:hypothetical protein
MKNFKTFGAMLDCSRNAVLKVESVKKMIDYLSAMGYNALELYTEDTFEVKGEPYFGYLRGRYSGEEIKEMDAYAKTKGVELIPCIETLAHMKSLSHWPAFAPIMDSGDALLIDEKKTYELLDKMFQSLAANYTSRRINIGLDETFAIGMGNHLKIHGYVPAADLYFSHLKKVIDIAHKYGFTPMFWGDMIVDYAGKGDYHKASGALDKSVKKLVPEGSTLIYWDYYHQEEKHYDEMMSLFQGIQKDIVFAPGVWTWAGFAPQNHFAERTIKPGLRSAIKHGVQDVFVTAWKDDGAECSLFAALSSFFFASEIAKGIEDEKQIKADFAETFGLQYDSFLTLDEANNVLKARDYSTLTNPSKYLLYNDPLFGFLDGKVTIEDDAAFENDGKKIVATIGGLGEFGYLGDSLAALCSVLALKASLGRRTRDAYQAGNRAEMKKLVGVYGECLKRLDTFIIAFRKQWLLENKPHGFDVQELRLGGLKERIAEGKRRLEEYLSGQISSIDELEETILPLDAKEEDPAQDEVINSYQYNSTVNVL